MQTRMRLGKLYIALGLAIVSSSGWLLAPSSGSVQQSYLDVQLRQEAREKQLASTPRAVVESKQSEEERRHAPRRLDLLSGASGQPLNAGSIFALSSPVGDGFGKLVVEKDGYGLEVKEPAGTWSRIPVVHFDKKLVLMRHGKDCVRLEDPVEPTANYYALCMRAEGITIHTVGELESFS